jgi:hypothetical protein
MRTGERGAVLVVGLLLLAPGLARAQDIGDPIVGCPIGHVGCHNADVDFRHRDALFDDVMLDSGWVPAGAPVQVRFAVFIGGSTEVEMGGTAVTSWPPALDVAVLGRPSTGRLAINYGVEIVARMRFDVEVAGVRYTWEGNIPVPGGIPTDLRLHDVAVFDPFVLPPSVPRPIVVWDDTDPVTLYDANLAGVIGIPGVSGGFLVDAVASLEGTYQTARIEVSDALTDIVEEGGSVVVRPDPGAAGFGAAKDYTVLPHGTIGYDGVITLYPTLYLDIAGRRFDLTLVEVPVRVVDLTANTRFEPASVHVPLPDARVEPTSMAFGEVVVGGAAERLLTVHNDGEAALAVTISAPPAPFSVSTSALSIPPRSSARVAVGLAPTEPGDPRAVLLLSTNDPDQPLISVRLSGLADGEADAGWPSADGGVGDGGGFAGVADGGCGCRAAGQGAPLSPRTGLALVALALLLAARSRPRSRR